MFLFFKLAYTKGCINTFKKFMHFGNEKKKLNWHVKFRYWEGGGEIWPGCVRFTIKV